jgi:drug/metabolite transporter (DMT)-like permease
MTFLLLAILCSASLPLLFRAFDDWRVNLFWAIPANYLVCILVGVIFTPAPHNAFEPVSQPWFMFAMLQGFVLAINFYLLGYTAQRAGVSVAALASRLSVAIPVILAFLLYDDPLTAVKIAGLVAALSSLYLCTGNEQHFSVPYDAGLGRLLPILVFFMFGCHFTLLKFAQARYLDGSSYHTYVTTSFFFAFVTSVTVGVAKTLTTKVSWRTGNIVAGGVLGVINYGAIYFLVKALSLEGWQSSQLFPTYSVGVVVVSSLIAMLLFKERLPRLKTLGLVAGLVAVALLNQ